MIGRIKSAILPLGIMGMRGLTLVAKFALTLFIARFMDLETLGIYGLIAGAAVVAPAAFGFGLMATLARKAVTATPAELTAMLKPYGALMGLTYGALAVPTLAAGYLYEAPGLALAVLVIAFLEHIGENIFTLLNNLHKPLAANILFFIRAGLWIALYMAAVFALPEWQNLEALLGAWIAGALLSNTLFFGIAWRWPWRGQSSAASLPRWLAEEFRQSRILYADYVANVGAAYADRYMIGLFLGLELTGVYVLFWSIANALRNLIRTSIIQVTRPKMVAAWKHGDPAFDALLRRCLKVSAASAAALSLAAGAAFSALLPSLEQPLALTWLPVLWLIFLGLVARVAFDTLDLAFYSRYEDRTTLVTGLVVLTLSLAGNAVLVPLFGLWGAGAAMIVAFGAGTVLRYVNVYKA